VLTSFCNFANEGIDDARRGAGERAITLSGPRQIAVQWINTNRFRVGDLEVSNIRVIRAVRLSNVPCKTVVHWANQSASQAMPDRPLKAANRARLRFPDSLSYPGAVGRG